MEPAERHTARPTGALTCYPVELLVDSSEDAYCEIFRFALTAFVFLLVLF